MKTLIILLIHDLGSRWGEYSLFLLTRILKDKHETGVKEGTTSILMLVHKDVSVKLKRRVFAQ